MKRVLRRSTFVLIFTIAFIIGIGFFTAELVFGAKDWIAQPYNAHVAGNGGLEEAGSIYDRNGEVLAQTVDGKRVYNSDKIVRRALLHTVGDDSLNISTAVQSKYRSLLTNYSLIWGLNMPQSMRTSRDVTLTVDAQACKTAYEALEATGCKGAVVIYNYKTGEVICSVSNPTYDPADPPVITSENEQEYDGVYLNNVLSSTYIPGSIFKIVTAAAAIENNVPSLSKNEICYCEGVEVIGEDQGNESHEIKCYDGESHGSVDLTEAMKQSCNIAFAHLTLEVGAEKMQRTADLIGINSSFKVDDIPTAKGHYEAPEYDENLLAWTGIGQGSGEYEDRVNPMQMAVICGAIGNNGTAANPTYIKDGTDDILEMMGFKSNEPHKLLGVETAQRLDAVMPQYDIGGLSVRAKTGTAEIDTDQKINNAWFVGYSVDDDCPLAFACVVERTQGTIWEPATGSTKAKPIIEQVLPLAAQAVRGY